MSPERTAPTATAGASTSSADLKTKWRGLRMALGLPDPRYLTRDPADQGLNRDATIFYKKGEGAKLHGGR